MAFLKVTGIVTRYVNYKDHDRILSIFTAERGRIDARARGCRRPKSPLLACAQPFVYGEFQFYESKERYTIDQCDVRETFYPLREDMDKLASGYAMLALTQAVVQEAEGNPALFSSLYHALSFLCYTDNHPLDISLCFMLRFLANNGFCPTITNCAGCGRDLRSDAQHCFSRQSGGALCSECAQGKAAQPVSSLTLEAMRRMLLLEDADMQRVKLPEKTREELLKLLVDYVEYTLDKPFIVLKALQALAHSLPVEVK